MPKYNQIRYEYVDGRLLGNGNALTLNFPIGSIEWNRLRRVQKIINFLFITYPFRARLIRCTGIPIVGILFVVWFRLRWIECDGTLWPRSATVFAAAHHQFRRHFTRFRFAVPIANDIGHFIVVRVLWRPICRRRWRCRFYRTHKWTKQDLKGVSTQIYGEEKWNVSESSERYFKWYLFWRWKNNCNNRRRRRNVWTISFKQKRRRGRIRVIHCLHSWQMLVFLLFVLIIRYSMTECSLQQTIIMVSRTRVSVRVCVWDCRAPVYI